MSAPLLVVGLGYSGAAIADRAIEEGARVWGTTTSVERASALERADGSLQMAVVAFPSDATSVRIAALVGAHATAVVTVGTRGSVDDARADARSIGAWLVAHEVERFVYLSSTSVYGDRGGDWVDADTAVAPDTRMGHRRVAAEEGLQEATGGAAMILRLPGIYGPGRTCAERLSKGAYVVPSDHSKWSNRIHVDDIATAVHVLLAHGTPGASYIACDDEPFPAEELPTWAAERLGFEPPTRVPFAELSERAKPFWSGSRRFRNDKLKALGWAPAFPNYRAGHEAAWRAEGRRVSPGEDG